MARLNCRVEGKDLKDISFDQTNKKGTEYTHTVIFWRKTENETIELAKKVHSSFSIRSYRKT